MTQARIRQRLRTIHRHQMHWESQEKQLQDNCSHPDVDKTYRGNTGNYDPSADCYWIEWRCPDCGKFWTTDQ